MHHTWYRDTPDAPRAEATGHTCVDGVLHANRTPFHFVGDGGLVITAADLARWSLVFQDPYPLGRELARAIADTALAASLDASLPDWTETLPADGRHSPTYRALTTPAPNVPTGWPPGRTGTSPAPIAGRWSIGRR